MFDGSPATATETRAKPTSENASRYRQTPRRSNSQLRTRTTASDNPSFHRSDTKPRNAAASRNTFHSWKPSLSLRYVHITTVARRATWMFLYGIAEYNTSPG